METWKPVAGIENLLEVSSAGRIRDLRLRQIVAPCKPPHGTPRYFYVVFVVSEGVNARGAIHRMVCRAFHGDPGPGKWHARHLNGDSHDNRTENLAWGTATDNMQDQIAHGRTQRGEKNRKCKMTEADVLEAIRLYHEEHWTFEAIGKHFNVTTGNISHVMSGRNWKHVPKPTMPPKKNHRLTLDQIKAIKAAIAEGLGPTEIGRRFGISAPFVCDLKAGRAWRDA